jgi:hypothetical protein
MTSYTKCKSQAEAIKTAKAHSAEYSVDVYVLLMSGDTLTIYTNGTQTRTAGWVRSGNIFCGPKAYAVAQ